MKSVTRFTVIFCLLLSSLSAKESQMNPVDFVNPFICTEGDHGQLYPGATCPFGTVKLSPDTYLHGFKGDAHVDYDFADTRILGFSHVRVDGMDCNSEGGNVLFLPVIGDVLFQPEKYHQAIIKSSEKAEPGYYAVQFENQILAELTATEHAGLHRYQFPAAKNAKILKEPIFDRTFTTKPKGYLLEMVDDCGTMAAWFVFGAMGFFPVCVGEPVYEIGMQFSKRSRFTWMETISPARRL